MSKDLMVCLKAASEALDRAVNIAGCDASTPPADLTALVQIASTVHLMALIGPARAASTYRPPVAAPLVRTADRDMIDGFGVSAQSLQRRRRAADEILAADHAGIRPEAD